MSHYFKTDASVNKKMREISYIIAGRQFKLITQSGIFSARYIDRGTNLLINVLIHQKLGSPVLDLGCGYGPIGLTLATFNPNNRFTLVDVNETAVALAKKNARMLNLDNVDIKASDGYQNINEKYSSIVINPPIRAGKQITYQLYLQAKQHLIKNGSLYVVIRKAQGAITTRRYLEENYAQVTMMKRSTGYHVYRADMALEKGDIYGKN